VGSFFGFLEKGQANWRYRRSESGQKAYTESSVATSVFHSKPHADVLRRVFDLPGRGMTRALAEGIVALDFPEADAVRIEELNVRANEGRLTEDEEAELEACVNIADLLAYWQSKARQTLRQGA
jgi:hypothetical protein